MKGGLGKRVRRETAKKLLEAELTRGTKPEKVNGKTTTNMVPLTEKDKTRIKHDLEAINKAKK
jgi:hypothetical protein